MPEPTIDDMLAYLDRVERGSKTHHTADSDRYKAIRAILEQHRDSPSGWIPAALMETEKREAIRAFVERVNRRMDAMIEGYQGAENTPKDKVPSFKRCFNEEYEATMEPMIDEKEKEQHA